jgi:ribosomal-protein-alanine N-acetyltransferase
MTTIREPRPSDIAELERLEQRCFPDPWPGRFFVSELFAPARFQRVVAEPGGVLEAYLFAAWQYLDLHILKVATAPERRRRGVALRLMALAEEHAREVGGETITLEVRPGNLAAIALYEALAFVTVGRRPGYYQDGEDALVMTKRVTRE